MLEKVCQTETLETKNILYESIRIILFSMLMERE